LLGAGIGFEPGEGLLVDLVHLAGDLGLMYQGNWK